MPKKLTTNKNLLVTVSEQRSLLAEMDISEPTLSQECMSVYRQLRSLVQQLKSHNDDDSGLHSDCSTTSMEENHTFQTGLLSEVAQELVGLVLDTDVVRLLERLDQARREIQERDVELNRRGETIMELTSKVLPYTFITSFIFKIIFVAALRNGSRTPSGHRRKRQGEKRRIAFFIGPRRRRIQSERSKRPSGG